MAALPPLAVPAPPALGPQPAFLQFFLPSESREMAALARARQEWPPHPRWHKGAGTHGTAPDCDWGFTGEDCDTPICGVETFQDPKSPYGDLREEKECAPMPSALARKSFPVRMARLGWDLGLYPLPGAVTTFQNRSRTFQLGAVLLLFVCLGLIKENAQLLFTCLLLLLWRLME